MAKVKSTKEREFVPYTITVETQEEHDFLFGLFNDAGFRKKEECVNYSPELDNSFFSLIGEMEDR